MYRVAALLLSLCFALFASHEGLSQEPIVRLLGPAVSRLSPPASSKSPASLENIASGRLVIVYRNATLPSTVSALMSSVGVSSATHLASLGISTLSVNGDVSAAAAQLRARPEVAAVLQDRVVHANRLLLVPILPMSPLPVVPKADSGSGSIASRITSHLVEAPSPAPLGRLPVSVIMAPSQGASDADVSYNSPQGWPILAAGGYGDNIPGGPATGPWTTSLGAGVRIAVLDTGLDPHHPDIAPNLALNLSEVDQTALPSPCDDGSPVDQMGHGTWVASLAAGAVGATTGEVAGVAPQATLLNIKVMERLAGTGATPLAQCEAGEGSGLLSWVLQGINDAVANHADVIVLSLSTLVDITTGDGEGWVAEFNQVTYAAQQAGTLIVAAAGNDGLDLSKGNYMELPAQARGVLPVVASTNPACAENLTVGATCVAGPITRASYSNHGLAGAVAAPGGNLPEGSDLGISGMVRGACASGVAGTSEGLPANGGSLGCFALGHTAYLQAMGTSASAPLVAGAAALLHAAHSDWSAAQTMAALQSTASHLPNLAEPAINLPAALALR